MKSPHGPFPRGALPRALLVPLGMALLTASCVSLDKPSALAACTASGTCADHVADAGGYAAADLPAAADLRQGDEPTGARGDGVENRPSPPDVDLDRPDGASGGLDLAGPDEALDAPSAESQRDSVASLDRALEPGPDVLAYDVFASVKNDAVNDLGAGKDDVLRTDAVTRDTSFEASTDQSVDSGSDCTIFYGSNMPTAEWGHPPAPNSNKGFCVVTCDEIDGWGCSNFDGRTVTVNGSPATCGSTKLVKKDGYFVFRVGPGSNISAAVYWWVFNPTTASNWATSCPAPAGGF
jgi:hypothetical protein